MTASLFCKFFIFADFTPIKTYSDVYFNIDYIKYDENSKINDDIMDFIDKILPKEEMKTYLLKLFSRLMFPVINFT